MKLLDALVEVVESQRLRGIKSRDGSIVRLARLAHFAFDNDGGNAFLSEIEVEELVPLLEEWCAEQRINMGTIQ